MGMQISFRFIVFITTPLCTYMGIFYVHFSVLNKAGPHDSIMTSAFQVHKIQIKTFSALRCLMFFDSLRHQWREASLDHKQPTIEHSSWISNKITTHTGQNLLAAYDILTSEKAVTSSKLLVTVLTT